MLMFKDATRITREDLRHLDTPSRTRTHRPIPHAEVVDAMLATFQRRGLRVRNESYAVQDGAMEIQNGERVTVPAARLFATVDFEVNGYAFPNGVVPSAGIRNAHDKRFSLSILSGARVLVCSNGVLSAEHIISRKHTSGISVRECAERAFVLFNESTGNFLGMYERMTRHELELPEAEHLVVQAARNGAFSPSDIIPVLDTYLKPPHEEFAARNAWSLYNAATEVMKGQSPARQVDGFKALTATLALAA